MTIAVSLLGRSVPVKSPPVLLEEPVQQLHGARRHVDHAVHTGDEPVVRLEELHLLGQIALDRLRDAAVEEFRVCGRVEVPVVVCGVVQHFNIAARRRAPLDVRQ
ncbi:MAG: hypothetical protein ACRENI_01030 [Gemmatimonadaceae bacterium]